MAESPDFYARLARGLLRDRPDLARRYLSLLRRHRRLRRGVRQAHAEAVHRSPLSDVKFRAPLSVAGCPSIVVVRAERLAMDGVPVAFDLDGRGHHRGTPLAALVARLNRVARLAGLAPVTEAEALGLYRAYMAASPRLLPHHPERRYAVLPGLIERVRRQMEDAQEAMLAVYAAREPGPTLELAVTASYVLETSRFMVFADRDSLAEALDAAHWLDAQSVIVGYNPRTGLRVNKLAVATAWGRGEGVAVVRLEDLSGLLSSGGDGPVGIECLPETWRGWPAGRDQHAPAQTFRYCEAAAD